MTPTSTVPGPDQPSELPASTPKAWSFAHRLIFRFVFSFLVICIFPFPISTSPGSIHPTTFYDRMWFAAAQWIAVHIFHVPPSPPYFSDFLLADTNAGYIDLLCFAVLAALATIVWTLFDRKRPDYKTLHEYLRIYVRYALGFTMLAYGFDKVLVLQFSWSLPGPERLALPLGNYSPFALMWTFMGYSTAYTIFAGVGEVVGGLLLLFRRTTTLGALIICGVMANVVALNFSYGVPVKIFSSLLLLQAVFLLAPEAQRLLNIFVLNRTAPPANLDGPFPARWMPKPRIALNLAIVIFSIYWFSGPYLARNRVRANAPKSPFYGLYQVESFTQNGTPESHGDKNWRRAIFESPRYFGVLTSDDSMRYFTTTFDVAKNAVTISGPNDPDSERDSGEWKSTFTFVRPDAEHLELRGNFKDQPTVIELRKIDISQSTLLSRGFHWTEDGGFYQ